MCVTITFRSQAVPIAMLLTVNIGNSLVRLYTRHPILPIPMIEVVLRPILPPSDAVHTGDQEVGNLDPTMVVSLVILHSLCRFLLQSALALLALVSSHFPLLS
jgi:hypothetical protein